MFKVVGRVDKHFKQQLNEVELKRSLFEIRRNLLFLRQWLWFQCTRNRLMFWIGVTNVSLLLGASVALLTPIWSDRHTLGQLTANNSDSHRSVFLSNGLPYQVSRPVNILVMGIQGDPGVWNNSPAATKGTSDTMLLLRLDPERRSLRVLSIPRDSQVVLPNIGLGKIFQANSLGGPTLAARVVSKTLNNVPIDRYVCITTNALQQLVDRLGGVEIFVPQRMFYQDATQKLQIDLMQGWQTLDGEQAEQFARFRTSSGDLGRVQRQQLLLKALRDRLTSPAVLPRLPQIARILQTYVETNLSPEEIMAIANFAAALHPENFQMLLLPGDLSPFSKDPSSYWIYTPGQDSIMSKYFGTYTIGAAQKPKALTSLKIAVQNASGKPKVSQQVANYLKQRGFENVYIVSDWSDSQRQTEIIAQKGNLEAATNLQKVLGLGNLEADATGDLNSHLTIRVGQDWNTNTQLFQASTNDNSYGWHWRDGSKR